jgi:predicted phosphodiesterase
MKKLILEYIAKYPKLTKRKIATLLFKDHPELFKSAEDARGYVRWHTGNQGNRSRVNSEYDIALPTERNKDRSPYQIPVINNNILVMSDLHIPFHDNQAIELSCEHGMKHNINTILLNGDIFDFYSESKFVKDPRQMNSKSDLNAGREFLHWLKEQFPQAKIIFKIGNHEERYEIYMMQNAPVIFQTDLFHVEDLLGLPELGIDCVSDKRIIKAGKLNILHGHELKSRAGGVNPARTTYLYTHKSVLIGHFHRTSLHTEPDLDKKVISCWSTGCLCNLHADYDPYNRWNQGAAIVQTDGEYYEVENFRIINGKVVG